MDESRSDGRRRLPFLFRGVKRPWNPPPGETPPSDKMVFEVCVIPGGRYALGYTMNDAVARLQDLLEREFGDDPLRWWKAEMEKLHDEDRDAVNKVAVQILVQELDRESEMGFGPDNVCRGLVDTAALCA